MGHDMKLDNSYFQSTREQLFEEYQKGVADLSIDDKSRMLEEIKILEHDNDELLKIQKEFKKLKEQKHFTVNEEVLEKLILNQGEIVKKMEKQLHDASIKGNRLEKEMRKMQRYVADILIGLGTEKYNKLPVKDPNFKKKFKFSSDSDALVINNKGSTIRC